MSLPVEGSGPIQVPRALMQAFLQQDPNHPGLETVRLPGNPDETPTPTHCREIETELCLVCRRCGRAYPQESTLLSHQRSCYLGNQQRRGALRLVKSRYTCALCGEKNTGTFGTIGEWRRHAESSQHQSQLDIIQKKQDNFNALNKVQENCNDSVLGEEANPLIDEMEDVVNQITLLAARAAAESTKTTTTGASQVGIVGVNQDNNNGPEAKRQKLMQEVAALAGAR